MKKDYWLYLIAGVCGAALWYYVTAETGKREAWDSGLYFSVAMPATCLVSLVCGYFEPRHFWRWGIAPMVGQFVWMLVTQGPGNLLPLGIVVFGVLSAPGIAAAWAGAFIANRLAKGKSEQTGN